MRPLEWRVRKAPLRVRGLRHTGHPPREAGPLHPAEGLNTARGRVRENMSLSDRPAGTSASSCISDSDSDWESLRRSGRISRRPTALLDLLSLLNSLGQSLLSTPCWFCFSGEPRWYSCPAPPGALGAERVSQIFLVSRSGQFRGGLARNSVGSPSSTVCLMLFSHG